MSYSRAAYRASYCFRSSFLHSVPQWARGLSHYRAGIPRPSCVLPAVVIRCASQHTRPFFQSSSPPLPRLKPDALESFALHVCKGQPQASLDTVRRLILQSETPAAFNEACVHLMATFARQGDILVTDRILYAAHKQFDFRVGRRVHSVIVDAFLDTGHLREASMWLQDVPNKPGSGQVEVHLWNKILAACLSHEQYPLFLENMQYIQDEKAVQPDAQMYTLIFEAIFRFDPASPPSIDVVRKMVEHMKQVDILFSAEMRDILVDGYSKFGAHGTVRMVERMYANEEQLTQNEAGVAGRIAERLVQAGWKSARNLLQGFLRQGFIPTIVTLEAVAEHISTVKSLHDWETHLRVVASPRVWALVLRNAANTPPADAAVAAYRAFLKRDLVPTPAIMHSVIRAVCSVSLRLPSDNDIRLALELHREYVRLVRRRASSPAQDDLPIYNTLIRAIVSTSNADFYPSAVSLLEEIHARGIITDYMTTTSLITLLMRIAPDADSAFQVYRTLFKYPDGSYALDGPGFRSILDVFSRNCFSKPSHYSTYASIARDMRYAGHSVSVENYTILLRKLGELATRAQHGPEGIRELALTIKRVHNALTVEASIAPDTMFWNQLMDTYQRAGCFREAFKVWNSLFIYRRYDNASVSIVVDVCAYVGDYEQLGVIFTKLYDAGFKLNQKNWGNWIEGLARVGKIDEATKVLCLAMPQEKIQPTKEMAKMLLTFAARTNQETEVRQRIKMYLPKLYNEIYP